MTSTLYLVDASPYIFRAYFSMPLSIESPEGLAVNAVYGFANFLIQLTARDDLTHLAVTFDESLTTSFRNEFFPEYKAQRDLPPPELEAQLKGCQSVSAAMGAAGFVSERYEADDLIATLARRHRDEVDRLVVVSSDKDLAQLVDDKVTMFDFAKDRHFDPEGVGEFFGVAPSQILDLLALKGDSVDNIPGVKGVGDKSARALLQAFGSLDEIYRRLDEVPELAVRGAKSIARKLEEGKANAELSRRLATLADAPVESCIDELRYAGADRKGVEELFAALGFERIVTRIPRWR